MSIDAVLINLFNFVIIGNHYNDTICYRIFNNYWLAFLLHKQYTDVKKSKNLEQKGFFLDEIVSFFT